MAVFDVLLLMENDDILAREASHVVGDREGTEGAWIKFVAALVNGTSTIQATIRVSPLPGPEDAPCQQQTDSIRRRVNVVIERLPLFRVWRQFL